MGEAGFTRNKIDELIYVHRDLCGKSEGKGMLKIKMTDLKAVHQGHLR